jgi:GTP cyclohydrolase III
MEKFEANFKPEIKLTEKEIELLKKLIDAIQLYSGSEDIKNPTEVLEPEYHGPSISTETVGAPIGREVYKYSIPIITFFIKKSIPEYPNIKEEQLKKAIEKVLEEMKDYLEKVGIGIDKKEELTNLIISLLKQVQQE